MNPIPSFVGSAERSCLPATPLRTLRRLSVFLRRALACRRGMRAIGYEPHPFFCRIGRAKLPPRNALENLEKIERVLAAGLSQPKPVSLLSPGPARFLRKLFPDSFLEILL